MTRTSDEMFTKYGVPAIDCSVGDFVYRMRDTGENSNKFGVCEICGKHSHSVFLQTEGVIYSGQRVTYHGCRAGVFGCYECLIAIRR